MLLCTQEKRTKQVVMGKLCVHDSFGEISVITDEPITCSIVTATQVELAVIEPDKLKGTYKPYELLQYGTIKLMTESQPLL